MEQIQLIRNNIIRFLVYLSWTNVTLNYSAFRIERAADASFSTGLTNITVGVPTPGPMTTFNDTGVLGGKTYYYRIFATNSVGDSAPSNSVTITTP
jgi:hypothetical protein